MYTATPGVYTYCHPLSLHDAFPDTHVIAVCQPSVPVLAAVAAIAAAADPLQPASMTLMGGPIDTRRNPTVVNELAGSRSLAWFERSVIHTVPLPTACRSAERRVGKEGVSTVSSRWSPFPS